MSNTIHNFLTDQGETYILKQTFRKNGINSDDDTVQRKCITNDSSISPAEGLTADQFDTDNTLDDSTTFPCKADGTVDITTTQGIAVVGSFIFQCPANIPIGENIRGI